MAQNSPDSSAPQTSRPRGLAAIPWRKLFIGLWALYGLLSLLFCFTKGMAVDDGDGKPFYVIEFNDVEQNDALFLIQPGILFGAIGAAWGFRRRAKQQGIADFVVYAVLLLMQAWCLLLAEDPFINTFDDTIRLTHNLDVIAWCVAYALLWAMFFAGTLLWLGKSAIRLLRWVGRPKQREM